MRMGKGKGNLKHWCLKLKAGSILFNFFINKKIKIKKLLENKFNKKLPINLKLI